MDTGWIGILLGIVGGEKSYEGLAGDLRKRGGTLSLGVRAETS